MSLPSSASVMAATLLTIAAAACATESFENDAPPTASDPRDSGGAGDASGDGEPTTTKDGGADGATPAIECDASGCSATVGKIRIFAFPSRTEIERVVQVLSALPPSLTRDAGFDVTRDATSQTGCPDPTRTALSALPAHCGYAGVDASGPRLVLQLRDTPFTTLPARLDHVLTDFAARDWFLAHQDEVLSMRYGKSADVWNSSSCAACPADSQEACLAFEGDSNLAYVQSMRDFTSSVAATLLKEKAWGGVGATWRQSGGATCSAPQRQAWLVDRLVAEKPPVLEARGLDIAKLCGPGKSTVRYTLRTTSGTADVTLLTVGGTTGAKIIPSIPAGTATTTPTTKQFDMTDGMVRMVARSSSPFLLELVNCP